MSEVARFTAPDGVEVAYRHWPAEQRRGSVVIAHGASEHSGRYARFAARLASAGYDVVAPDHRGHGLTATANTRGVIGPRGLDGVLEDLDHLVQQADRPVLFGHSMGSVIALRYAETRPEAIRALALSGPIGVQAGVDEAFAQLQAAVDAGMGEQPMDALGAFNESFEPARTPFDWLSRDPAEVDAYLADPFCGANLPLTYGYVRAIFAGVRDGAAQVSRLPSALPVLITAGERDPVSDGTRQARELASAMRAAGLADVVEVYYPQARHEILNETNRDEVEADVLAWVESHRDR